MIGAKLLLACAIAALLIGESPLLIGALVFGAWLLAARMEAVGSPDSGW